MDRSTSRDCIFYGLSVQEYVQSTVHIHPLSTFLNFDFRLAFYQFSTQQRVFSPPHRGRDPFDDISSAAGYKMYDQDFMNSLLSAASADISHCSVFVEWWMMYGT